VPIVNVFKLFPRVIPEIVDAASLDTAIAADALISALTITPVAIAVALPIEVTSPVKFAFVVTLDAVPVRFAVIVPALKLPEPSLATIVLLVLALVALEVTVNVDAPD
jgi:hypothetical protein